MERLAVDPGGGVRALGAVCGVDRHLVRASSAALEPLPTEWDSLAREGREARPYTHVRPPTDAPTDSDVDTLYRLARTFPLGVISCGPLDADSGIGEANVPASIAALGAAAGWPILADPTSQMRSGPHTAEGPVLATSDLFLRVDSFAAAHAPEVVVRIGATPTSKPFRLWIEHHQPAHVVAIEPALLWNDPSHLVSEVLRCAVGPL